MRLTDAESGWFGEAQRHSEAAMKGRLKKMGYSTKPEKEPPIKKFSTPRLTEYPTEKKQEFQASSEKISKELAERSHAGTSWSPEIRAQQEIEGFTSQVTALNERLQKHARTEAQKNYLSEQMAVFQDNYARKYNEYLAVRGRGISSFIAGPSNFPVRRAEKAQASLENKINELNEFKERVESAITRNLKKMGVEEAGGETAVLAKKIEHAERLQERMKLTNTILKKKRPRNETVKELVEKIGVQESIAIQMLEPDFAGRIGYSFQLSNNSADIRRMKERLAMLQAKEATPSSEISFLGGRIVDNAEADRVQIIHDVRPAQEVINALKSEGWRWSPFNRAWQRQRTPAAMISAKRITGLI